MSVPSLKSIGSLIGIVLLLLKPFRQDFGLKKWVFVRQEQKNDFPKVPHTTVVVVAHQQRIHIPSMVKF